MAFLSAAVYSLALPMQWKKPHMQLPSTPEDAVTEPLEGSALEVYHWLLPLQLASFVVHLPDPLRPGAHRAAVLATMAAVWAASVVYPMDWGKAYQDWPLPTVFAGVVSFLLCQTATALGWKYWASGSGGEAQ